MNEKQVILGTPSSKSNAYKIISIFNDEERDRIISLYEELGNVWKVADKIGRKGQQVHMFLTRCGLINKMNYFSDTDKEYLAKHYKEYRDVGKLEELAKILGRTKPFIVRKARELSLTDSENRISMKPFLKDMSERTKLQIQTKGHPRGFLNGKHSTKMKEEMSERVKKEWKDPSSKFNSDSFRQGKSDRQQIAIHKRLSENPGRQYSNAKNGTVCVGGKTFFARSAWESNIAAYLQYLKERGEIKEWTYEPVTFWFDKIKRGVRSYKPDFLITNLDSSEYYIEVKGWMDPKSVTKLKRMKIYYPGVKIEVIDQKRYAAIAKTSFLFKEWGLLDAGAIRDPSKICTVDRCPNMIFKKDVCRKHYKKIFTIKPAM